MQSHVQVRFLIHVWLIIWAASTYMTEHWRGFLIYDWTFLQCSIKEEDFLYIWGCTLSLKFPNTEKFSLAERLVFQARIQPLLQPVEDLVAVLHHRLLTANHCQCVSTNPTMFNQFQPVPTIPCHTQLNWHILQPVKNMVAVLHHRLLTANHCHCFSTNPNQF